MRRSFLFAVVIGFCAGIVLAEFGFPKLFILIGGSAGAVLLCFSKRSRIIGCAGLCLVIGIIRWYGFMQTGETPWASVVDHRVQLTASVTDDPVEQGSRQEVELVRVRAGGMRLPGKMVMTLPAFPKIPIGQRLGVVCTLKRYTGRDYLRKRLHDIRAECQDPEIVSAEPDGWSVRGSLGAIKSATIQRITRQFSEPQSSLLIGILLGRQVRMPPDIDAAFRATGTTHMIALSGFNVTIMITALSAILVRLIGQRWAWLPALLVVIGFVIMTGASASVTRAGMMAGITLLAGRLGRPVAMFRLLSYTLLVMVWHNPLVLLHDLGFQLSFLATLGLVYLSPKIEPRLRGVPERFSIRENLATTLGAILATEPLLLWHFARVSTVAPLVNVLVLPLIPLTMAAGCVSIILPLTWSVADALLRLVLAIIQSGANLPFASQNVSGIQLVLIAGLVGFVGTRILYARTENKAHPA